MTASVPAVSGEPPLTDEEVGQALTRHGKYAGILAPIDVDTVPRLVASLRSAREELKTATDREAAKARLHPALHELDVRISDLPGECHCNLVAEVILDAVYGRESQVPRHDDVRTAPQWWMDRGRPAVELVAGGPPCQPFSTKGKRRGVGDARWGWPWMRDVIAAVQPRYVLVENVAALLRDAEAMSIILGDLSGLGFDAEWELVSACAFGAPHTRERLFLVAHPPAGDGEQQVYLPSAVEAGRSGSGTAGGPAGTDGWLPEPDVGRVAHGLPKRVVAPALWALGNAVVPQVAERVGHLILRHRSALTKAGQP